MTRVGPQRHRKKKNVYLCNAIMSWMDSVLNSLILTKKELLRYLLCTCVLHVVRYLNCAI